MVTRTLSQQEREILSRAATIGNLERAGQPDYDGRKATSAARSAAWRSWLDKAGGDPVKAKRLRTAALMRGREAGRRKRESASNCSQRYSTRGNSLSD